MEWVQLTTVDGHVLDADLSGADHAVAGAVLCHPHPQYGGSRFDHVVTALFETLPLFGVSTVRFDFRRTHGHGVDERLDAMAAVDLLADRLAGNVPLHLVGYSFGAMVALSSHHPNVMTRVAIAPPLPADPDLAAAGPPSGPVLVVVPQHDQFCPPDQVRPAIASWPDAIATELAVVEMADHFLAGRTAVVAELVGRWVAEYPEPPIDVSR